MNQPDRTPRFYFALLRLLAKWRGGDATRSEANSLEAWVAGVAIYGISYLFFAALIPAIVPLWGRLLLLLGVAVVTMLFWLLALYLNSLVIRLLRALGLCVSTPDRFIQSVLLAAAATAMACGLIERGGWRTELAAIWIVAVAMNLLAATILALSDGRRV
ncbi:MAG TPA: hypothetical protein VM940_08580 [Chthoniobacterales bacterium]|jgi:hypothetical protein|nr:hypothetical protein [Chthoniobacterales bacterium]